VLNRQRFFSPLSDQVARRVDASNVLDQQMLGGFWNIAMTAVAVRTDVAPTAAVLYACDVCDRCCEWHESRHSVFDYDLLETRCAGATA
jgi:hypothetical protein